MAMAKTNKEQTYAFNPFNNSQNVELLMTNLDKIDSKNIRYSYKNTKDPINLAFDMIENTPITTLAKDFVKESLTDIMSFITSICK